MASAKTDSEVLLHDRVLHSVDRPDFVIGTFVLFEHKIAFDRNGTHGVIRGNSCGQFDQHIIKNGSFGPEATNFVVAHEHKFRQTVGSEGRANVSTKLNFGSVVFLDLVFTTYLEAK